MVKRFVDKAEDKTTQDEIERLIDGRGHRNESRSTGTDLSDEVDRSIDNLWSVLFTTGYLTLYRAIRRMGGTSCVIPNREVREVFVLQIQEWFKKSVAKRRDSRCRRCARRFWMGTRRRRSRRD